MKTFELRFPNYETFGWHTVIVQACDRETAVLEAGKIKPLVPWDISEIIELTNYPFSLTTAQ